MGSSHDFASFNCFQMRFLATWESLCVIVKGIVDCQNTLDMGSPNATVAPGHSSMPYHHTSTFISQDNNTIMCFIPIAALRASAQII